MAAPDPAAQLMQLRQAETLGVLDHHDGGVGDVDADLDDGGGDENASTVPSRNSRMVRSRSSRFHAPMHQTDTEIFEQCLAHLVGHLGGVLHLLQLLGGFDQRQDDKGLMAFF